MEGQENSHLVKSFEESENSASKKAAHYFGCRIQKTRDFHLNVGEYFVLIITKVTRIYAKVLKKSSEYHEQAKVDARSALLRH